MHPENKISPATRDHDTPSRNIFKQQTVAADSGIDRRLNEQRAMAEML